MCITKESSKRAREMEKDIRYVSMMYIKAILKKGTKMEKEYVYIEMGLNI